MELRILVDAHGIQRKFLWMKLAPPSGSQREAISVGFSDPTFVVPRIESEMILNTEVHVTALDLRANLGEAAITNPHFTFHAPAWMHLRANGEEPLLEQLVCLDLAVPQHGRVPWLRFVSKAVRDLTEYAGARAGVVEEVVAAPQCADVSIAVTIDFVDDSLRAFEKRGQLVNRIVQWHGWLLHLAVDVHPSRESSTFTWFQEN